MVQTAPQDIQQCSNFRRQQSPTIQVGLLKTELLANSATNDQPKIHPPPTIGLVPFPESKSFTANQKTDKTFWRSASLNTTNACGCRESTPRSVAMPNELRSPATHSPTELTVNRSLIHSHRRFFDGFGQGGMSVTATSDVFRTGSKTHCDPSFSNQLASMSPNDVHA